MEFREISPPESLKTFIECYWHIQDLDARPYSSQKIIPDGMPEIIFHFGDPYQIQVDSDWCVQAIKLVAGQFRSHFLLRNTGRINVLGVKFRPWALGQLYGLPMTNLVDQVHPISQYPNMKLPDLNADEANDQTIDQMVAQLNETFQAQGIISEEIADLTDVLAEIQDRRGLVKIASLSKKHGITERRLERFCLKMVGISPKFLARIFRMKHVFNLMKERNRSWTEIAFRSGFFDQSHFIKNFKEFTGEDPSSYLFDAETLANFFVRR